MVSTAIGMDLDTLDCTLWFTRHLTQNFETRHLSVDCEEPLIHSLIKYLYISNTQQLGVNRHIDRLCAEIVRNTLSTLINLTKCESIVFGKEDPRCDFASDVIVKYEKEG